MKALDETVKILAENQKAMANAETSLNGVQGETPDPAQVQAERERIQQLCHRDAGQDGRPLAAELCES